MESKKMATEICHVVMFNHNHKRILVGAADIALFEVEDKLVYDWYSRSHGCKRMAGLCV